MQMKRFYNRWTHSFQYGKCGRCPSCQQEKALKRTSRIRNATYDGYVCLFVTLTYRNFNIPYIRRDELLNNPVSIAVYRDADIRRVRISSGYRMQYRYRRLCSPVATVDCFNERIFPSVADVRQLKKLRGQSDSNKIGVLLYSDVQKFEKRLRTNLVRRYGIDKPVYSFKCAEYGPTYGRPHFHLLVYVPQENLDECTSAIHEAWPYDDCRRYGKSVELARNPAGYVSSYVNRGSDFPRLLSARSFSPRHSFSLGFGLQNPAFTLPSIIERTRNGSLRYAETRISHCVPVLKDVLFPSYVLNRYFPKFLGYSRLTHSEIRELIANPGSLYLGSSVLDKLPICLSDGSKDWKKVSSLCTRLEHLFLRFRTEFVYYEDSHRYVGLPDNFYTRELYADYYYDVWRTYASNIYQSQFQDVFCEQDMLECYYNLAEVRQFSIPTDLSSSINRMPGVSNPNLFKKVVTSSFNMADIYDKRLKQRKVTNRVMCESGFNV